MLKRTLTPPYRIRHKYDAQPVFSDFKRTNNSVIVKADAALQYALSHRNNMNNYIVNACVDEYAGGFVSCSNVPLKEIGGEQK